MLYTQKLTLTALLYLEYCNIKINLKVFIFFICENEIKKFKLRKRGLYRN